MLIWHTINAIPIMEYLRIKILVFINLTVRRKRRDCWRERRKSRGKKEREGTIQGPQTSEEKLKSLQ